MESRVYSHENGGARDTSHVKELDVVSFGYFVGILLAGMSTTR